MQREACLIPQRSDTARLGANGRCSGGSTGAVTRGAWAAAFVVVRLAMFGNPTREGRKLRDDLRRPSGS